MGNLDNVIRKYKDNTSKDKTSRYRNHWRVLDNEGDLYQESYNELTITSNSADKIHEVKAGEENRLDLISYNYYGSPLLWWVIAEASDITNPFNVPIGTLLRIPANKTLYGSKGILT